MRSDKDLIEDAVGYLLQTDPWWHRIHLTGLGIAVVIGAVCTRTAVTETDSHTVDLRPGSDGRVRWRRGTLSDSVEVFERLQFNDTGL